jgi:phosphatidylinositol alpha-1,6-mannosyltransferase
MQSECLIVTQCFYPDVGGIETLMTALADNCAAAGRSVTVLAERVRNDPAAPPPDKPYSIERFGGPRPWRRLRKRARLASILRDRGAKLAGIFADSWKSVEALPSRLDTPVSVLAHGMEFPLHAPDGKKRRIAAALARCDAVIANSHYTAKLVRPYLGDRPEKLQIIHPAIDPIALPSADAMKAMRSRMGGGEPIIATVARLEPRKGIDAVISALPEILERYPGCLYTVGGAGSDRGRLEELAASLHVRQSVVFLGRVSDADKAALLAVADVFAMPVRREGQSVEGFGISYLEAGWFGIPSLAGRDGGAADAVLNGETGLVCEGADQGEVEYSLLSLLGDAALRKRLGTAAQDRVKRELIWPVAIQRYLETFSNAAKRL